jgi:dipeptidyl aminopeptidase/acylaminoacyl peptidase
VLIRPLRRTLLALTFLLVPALPAPGALAGPVVPAATLPDETKKRPLTVDEIWAMKRLGAPVLSPDGSQVAYAIWTYDPGENQLDADVWTVPAAGGAPRRLTTYKGSSRSPAFSPDGKRIVFVSKREGDKQNQIYILPLDGGEAERVTEMPLGVSSPKWLPDGKRIAFVSPVIADAESPEATKKKVEEREKTKVKARVTENRLYRFWDRWLTDDEFPHIFVVDVSTRKVTDLLSGSKRFFDLQEAGGRIFDVSLDGSAVTFSANSSPEPYAFLNEDVFLVPTSGGEVRDLTSANGAADIDPVFSPDGKRIAYGLKRRPDSWPDRTRLAILDLATGKTTVLTEDWDVSPSSWVFTPDGQSLVVSAEVRARTNLYAVPLAGGAPREIYRGGTVTGPQVTPSGEVFFSISSLSKPPEIAAVKTDGTGFRWLTHTNDERMAGLALGKVRDVTFEGAGSDPTQMFVVEPYGFEPKKKIPLVHLVHGGPVGTSGDAFSFRWNAHAFAAPGYLVAMVNFHGSSSFGQKWVESILGAPPDKPFTDVMKATDFLIAEGSVDEGRIAAAGGSYGGFLVNWIAGHTARFTTLVSHAGVYDLLGQFASDVSFGRQHSYGGYPFTNLPSIERWSPNRYAKGFSTPMLILHGERDFRVPLTQGLEIYGVLTAKEIPARLVVYPDENHWILKGSNSKHWYGEVLGWLARWFK